MEYNYNRPDFPLKYRSGDDRPHTLPLAPRNVNITSPFLIGVIDIRWDNPAIYAENSGQQILGVNVYKAYNSPEAAYTKLNTSLIGALYFRDQTKEVTVTEDPLQGGRFIAGTTATGDWVAKTYNKPIIIPGTNGQMADNWAHVRVDVKETALDSFVTVPAFRVKGESGEIYLINSQVYNHDTNRLDDPVLPQLDKGGEVRITYTYIDNWIQTDLFRKIYYKVTTVAFDNTCVGGTRETPLNEVEAFSLYDMEKIDWIWAEAIRRNKWILEQGGERVKLFLRKWSGYICSCWDDQYRQAKQDCHVCFPAGQEVTLYDGTRKNIEQILSNDKVITAEGTISTVSDTQERDYSGKIYSISCIGKEPVVCTENHPFLVVKRSNSYCIKFSNTLNKSRCVPLGRSFCFRDKKVCTKKIEPVWVPAKYLELGDYLLTPVIKLNKDIFSEQEMFIFGMYLAEGSLSWNGSKTKYNRVRFSLGAQERDLIDYLKDAFFKCYKIKLKETRSKNVVELYCHSDYVFDRMIKNCGKDSHYKKVSNEIMESSDSMIKSLLRGYIMGDGHLVKNKYRSSYSTVSKNLASQLELLFSKIGIPVNSKKLYHIEKRKNWGESHWFYLGVISAHDTKKLELILNKKECKETKKNQHRIINYGDYIGYPIKSLKKDDFNGKVYNLTVADSHTYLVNNVSVHNCFGTGYISGYEGPLDIIVAPPETEKTVNLFDVGLHVNYNWSTWTGPYPLLTDRDFVVRQNNDRFSVAHINAQGSRGAIYQQHFELAQLDQTDIRYQVPITGGEVNVPPEYNQYRESRPTDASPVINDKPERPEQYQYKGRTVTFENIVM